MEAEKKMEQLLSLKRCCTVFTDEAGKIRLKTVSETLPFYMEYETKYDKKEKYNDIIGQFEQVQAHLFDEKSGLMYPVYDEASDKCLLEDKDGVTRLFAEGAYLAALVDTIEQTSIEIYEQYRKLCDIYKCVLKGFLPYRDAKTGLFAPESDEGNALVAYSILKACEMRILLQEKYMPIGMAMAERLFTDVEIRTGARAEVETSEVEDPETAEERADMTIWGRLYVQYAAFQKETERQ